MMQDVYENHLFYNKKPKLKPQQNPLGVLVGCVGTGKTTVFNLITNKQMKISDGGKSATRSVFSSPSGFGYQFSIMDTPGTGADEDKLTHAINLRMALIERPLSRIFLFLKFERHGPMMKNLAEQLFFLQEWKHLITVIVTHWDKEISPDYKNEYEMAKQKLMDNNDIVNSFIFIGIDANPESACNAIYQSLCIYLPTQLEISDKQFQYRFDLYENLGKAVNQQIHTFREMHGSIVKEIKNYNQDDKDEFMHSCIVSISQIAEQTIDEFIQKYCTSMQGVDNYVHYMRLKQSFTPMVEQVRKEASQRMSYSLYDQREPKNMFKACPHCGIIWVKVAGCDGETTCGNRLSGDYIFDRKPSATLKTPKFKFSWANKTFQWVKELVPFSQPETNTEETKSESVMFNLFRELGFFSESKTMRDEDSKSTVKAVGCGKPFVWGDQPPIDKRIMNYLKDVGITDFLVNHPQNKDFEELLEKEQKKATIIHLD